MNLQRTNETEKVGRNRLFSSVFVRRSSYSVVSLLMYLIKPSEFTHALDDLFETSNIRTLFEGTTIRRCMIFHLLINARHHIFETIVDLFGFPCETLCILCHL